MSGKFSPSILSQKYYFHETPFANLMRKRIFNVLLIASNYDFFILEEDNRIDEKIFNEYVALNLRHPPQIVQVSTEEEAVKMLQTEKFDLIISMLSMGKSEIFASAKRIKSKYPNIPFIVLTRFSREVSLTLEKEDLSAIDHVFSWLGNADLLLAIIKMVEDKMNVEQDVKEVGVQAILLVENSIRFYSSYLPILYKIILKQSLSFIREGLNEHQKTMRMRGRPKILLATNYEEAIAYYEKYKKNLLGVITDTTYNRNGKEDAQAGFKLARHIKNDNKYIPVLMQSSDISNKEIAEKKHIGFIHKHSQTFSQELKSFVMEHFAFGDFVFVDPQTRAEIARAEDLRSLQHKILEIPDDCFVFHISNNHISRWLYARAIFPLAELFRSLHLEDFETLGDIRKFIFETIGLFRRNKALGIIAEFKKDTFDEYMWFSRIGKGSIGGKARGLAFLDGLLKRNRLIDKWQDVIISIPRTVVITADIFDEFMEENNLYGVATSDISDDEILKAFVNATLPKRVKEDLHTFVHAAQKPIAIRSSSLLEDSYYQPFAGIYSTYMIPNNPQTKAATLKNLYKAIKGVYASAFFRNSKSYMTSTSHVIDEEKMAIVLQEVTGRQYGDLYYPMISGVARSLNFYPIMHETAKDGIANIATGLGKYIVDGGLSLRFSPSYPKNILQLSTPDMALKETQKYFYALNLKKSSFAPTPDDSANLLRINIDDAPATNVMNSVFSTYDAANQIMRDTTGIKGKKVVSFAGILKYNTFPLAEILSEVLTIGQKEMGYPVEIEFAVDLDVEENTPKGFNLLQIRPIVDVRENMDIDLQQIEKDNLVLESHSVLGNGIVQNIYDLVYVKPESFNPSRNIETAAQIEEINNKLLDQNRNYILIGPGRWGSSDPWLGIPVKWSQISGARLIVESGLENYRVEPSQGTHFFQNLTSFKVGYFTINPFMNDGFCDMDFLRAQETVFENDILRHVTFKQPVTIKIDARKNIGIITK